MNSLETAIASVVRREFRGQALLNRHGRERFMGRSKEFAENLAPLLLRATVLGARKGKGGAELRSDLEAYAEERALWLARTINETTGEYLAEGKDPFTADRAVMIGLTEAKNAESVGFSMALRTRKKKLKWVADGKPCKSCKRLDGRVRKPGEAFDTVDGVKILGPGLHPFCKCSLQEA